jgi:hypothetical protein
VKEEEVKGLDNEDLGSTKQEKAASSERKEDVK